jgi:hypothetical protein
MLTAQAAVIAHLTAENRELRAEVERLTREAEVSHAMRVVVDAIAALRAVQPVLRDSLRMGVA